MKAVIGSGCFARELGGWALRGVLCAAPSMWWAQVGDFNGPAEITGMFTGIACWVVAFAAFSRWCGAARVVAALKTGAWLKIVLSAAGWLTFALCSAANSNPALVDAGILGILPDSLMGVAAIRIVSAIAGTNRLETLDSAGWTSLITIVDGALFAFAISVLAVAVLLWWQFSPALLRKLKISPVRSAG